MPHKINTSGNSFTKHVKYKCFTIGKNHRKFQYISDYIWN